MALKVARSRSSSRSATGDTGARRSSSPRCTRAAVRSSSSSGRSATRRITAFTSSVTPTPISASSPATSNHERAGSCRTNAAVTTLPNSVPTSTSAALAIRIL